ncbi:MAG TPA: hypothetical protein VEY06_08875, partial [Flavisolibacter sp.]|nr:hypothetical protein [Flavisolibacter sp.]
SLTNNTDIMKKTTLHFKTIFQLWNFKKAIAACEVEVNLSTRTLLCSCKTEEVRLALDNYGASQETDRSISSAYRNRSRVA